MNARQGRKSRSTITTVALTALLGLGASACALPGTLGAAEASNPAPAPTTTTTVFFPQAKPTSTTVPTTVAPPTTTAPAPAPAPVGSRNPLLWPFASTSPWNTPIGTGAQLEGATGPMTSSVRATYLRTKDGSSTMKMTSWVNATDYSHPVYKATASDPVATVTSPWDPPLTLRVPASATPAAGTDAHLHVVQPDGRTIIEMWDVRKLSNTSLTAGRVEVVDLYGAGTGPDDGVRAYGGSAVGGLIRKWEVDPSDPNYTDGVIRHAIAIALPAGMLRYTGGASGYDANGFGTSKGYVWPATEQDWDSPSSYYGNIPMGQLFTIPKSVNVDALGLTPAARSIAKAIQDYGAYVTDRTGPSTFAFYAEPTVPASWYADVAGPSWTTAQLNTIRQNLVAVTNNGPSSVGGGGSRPVALAPPIG